MAAKAEPRPKQLSLWDQPKGPPAVRSRTSIAAAEAIREMAPTLRGKVYAYIVRQGEAGATRQEIADGLGMRLQTVCGRVGELLGQTLIWQGTETREGRKVLRPVKKHWRDRRDGHGDT